MQNSQSVKPSKSEPVWERPKLNIKNNELKPSDLYKKRVLISMMKNSRQKIINGIVDKLLEIHGISEKAAYSLAKDYYYRCLAERMLYYHVSIYNYDRMASNYSMCINKDYDLSNFSLSLDGINRKKKPEKKPQLIDWKQVNLELKDKTKCLEDVVEKYVEEEFKEFWEFFEGKFLYFKLEDIIVNTPNETTTQETKYDYDKVAKIVEYQKKYFLEKCHEKGIEICEE